jgi:hypothetical protein
LLRHGVLSAGRGRQRGGDERECSHQ